MPGAVGDTGRNAAKRLQPGQIMRATPKRPANVIAAGLDEVIETKSDNAVLANTDGRNRVADLCHS